LHQGDALQQEDYTMNNDHNPVEAMLGSVMFLAITACWIAVPVAGGYFIVKAIFG
jgi:hypothetical protein